MGECGKLSGSEICRAGRSISVLAAAILLGLGLGLERRAGRLGVRWGRGSLLQVYGGWDHQSSTVDTAVTVAEWLSYPLSLSPLLSALLLESCFFFCFPEKQSRKSTCLVSKKKIENKIARLTHSLQWIKMNHKLIYFESIFFFFSELIWWNDVLPFLDWTCCCCCCF